MKSVSLFRSFRYKKFLIFTFIIFFACYIIYYKPLNGLEVNLPLASKINLKELDLDASLEENLKFMDQADPRLIKYARIKYLTPPSKLEYQDVPGKVESDEFSSLIAEIFENKTGGIFIEAGANEGVAVSHSMYLEKHLGWTGLLVECNPNLYAKLKSHHRKAWIATVCLAPGIHPGIMNFSIPYNWSWSATLGQQWDLSSAIGEKEPTKWFQLEVETIPLFTLLAAIGLTEVDYFSFDIEGAELAVLMEFPFERVRFKVLVIELQMYDDDQKRQLDELLLFNKYHFVADLGSVNSDKLYVHRSVRDKLNLKRFPQSQ